ncbi:uncharacterized protein [Fopius arisanus]|uniref:Uncharacterized protein n=1 Tax=Fopius arisanus TaxID=64838 RepID=A0A9R1UBM6_9HYME|nr:PREDICTED: uncharacterized protein LOC105273675 [Fopius arisanus]
MRQLFIFALWGLVHHLGDSCVPTPVILKDVVDRCARSLSEEDKALIRSTTPDGGKLKDFSLCLYTGYGYYRNGSFDLSFIKKFVEDSTGDKSLAERVYVDAEPHLKAANALPGTDGDRTHSFWLRNYDEESRKLREELWC